MAATTPRDTTDLGRPLRSEIFTRFASDDIIPGDRQTISQGLWTDNQGSITTFFTSSVQAFATSSRYYVNVYDSNPAISSSADVQFAVAYGHRYGSGSIVASSNNNDTATRAIYAQYKNILLDPADSAFTFGSETPEDIVVININRSQLREKLDPGNWQLHLSGSLTLPRLQLIDDSGANTNATVAASGRVFNIVSGTIESGVVTAQTGSVYGLCYPDLGILVLNARALFRSASIGFETGSTASLNNNLRVFSAISGAKYFAARTEEEITSTHYFVRVKNSQYNFSNNPTFTTGSYGQIRQADFVGDPKVYITTIGMYNDEGDCLATAKTSQPILKTFTRETLIRVKLDY